MIPEPKLEKRRKHGQNYFYITLVGKFQMRFLFFVPDVAVVRGGISVILDTINVLNENNIEAVALYSRPDFEYQSYIKTAPRIWSPVVREPDLRTKKKTLLDYALGRKVRPEGNAKPCPKWDARPGDVLIVPEYVSAWMPDRVPQYVRKVLFNQNPFALLNSSTKDGFDKRNFHTSLSISDACSAANRMVMGDEGHFFPLCISKELFGYVEDKSFQVAYMPRKREDDSLALIKCLRASPEMKDISFVPIDGLSNTDAAKKIGESLFFLSFSEREGFGLPAAEAMATGSIVIGYSGVGGDEYFNEDNGYKVPEDNLMRFYEDAIRIVGGYQENRKSFDTMRRKASQNILEKYSEDEFKRGVLQSFSKICDNSATTS